MNQTVSQEEIIDKDENQNSAIDQSIDQMVSAHQRLASLHIEPAPNQRNFYHH